MEDNVLYDLPAEFLADIAEQTGFCDIQTILPKEGKYLGHCSCGSWDIVTANRDSGLAEAQEHTQLTDAVRAAAKA